MAFLAPEVPALQYYLFRTGRYWTTPYEPRDTAQLLALVEDPRLRRLRHHHPRRSLRRPDAAAGDRMAGGETPWSGPPRSWAAAGRPLPIRLFVRPAPGEAR
jgi:hypothetical protein